MVYCGRPSRGCQMCRTRRIKCDETKPTCKQCAKSRRQCPGYKHDFDIVFRNETSATKRRVNRGLGTKKKSHDQITFRTGYNNDEDKHNNESRSLAMTYRGEPSSSTILSVPIESQALCFFISNFVCKPRIAEGIGAFEYLIPIIKVEPRDSPISLAFAAVSLASLANRPNSRSGGLMIEAMTQHGKALKAINIALQTSITQKTDATLASILLLGFFETLTSEKTNMLAWGSHIDGAAQLTKIRGKKQLRTKTGLALFVTVRDQMLVNCISASKAPLASAHWWINVQEPSERGPDAFVAAISLRVAELRFEANDLLANSCRTPELLEKVNEIMKRAQAMDIEFQDWAERLPKDWLPQPVAWIDNIPGGDLMKSDIYPGRVDLYSDLIIAHTWNSARTCRLFIIGLIIRCVAWLGLAADYKTKPEYKFCHKIGSTLMTDIIASIPYHLGWPMDENGDLKAGDISSNSCHARDDPVSSPKALGGFYCIWPAFCVTSSDYATDSQRSWVKGRLRLIADLMGLNQARVYELRLPSMVVARDGMSPTPPTAT
ncbi:hypothetical protein BJ878DRAFT_400793, partial [Calycina marina]